MFTLATFYKSKEWQKLRYEIILERVNSDGDIVCEHCHKPILNKYDCIAHHKIYLTESNVNDFSVSLNAENIELVHHKCHNKIHKRFGTYTRHVYIVWGSPCSGKTSYVLENALPDDLIIDIDRLYDAMGTERSERLYANVMSVYRHLIDMVRTRNGKWVNAWIVRGLPNTAERERLANELDAELIFIDTPKEICLDRAEKRKYNYSEIVLDWWRKFTPPGGL